MRLPQFIALFAGLLLLAGCSVSEKAVSPAPPATAQRADTTAFVQKSARVFIEGREKATTPATLQVRRGFGEVEVVLVAGGNDVRTFEVERVYTSDASSLNFSFWGESSASGKEYDVQNLPTRKNGTVIIPYSPNPIVVEDREYGLTLLVTN